MAFVPNISTQINGTDLHIHLLTKEYTYSHNTPNVTINDGQQDLNGITNNRR